MTPYRLVEVTRFDLAPTMVASVAADYQGVFTPIEPDPAPHVTWRFVFASDKFMSAGPIAVGRRIMPEQEAAEAMCFALPCLALTDPVGDGWQWDDINVDETSYPRAYAETDAIGMTVPARIASLLYAAGDVRRDYDMVISSRVVGQDDAVNGIIRYNRFVSDEVSSDWIVRQQVANLPPFWGWTRTLRIAGDPVWNLPSGFDAGEQQWIYVPVEGLPAWRMTLTFDNGMDAPLTYNANMNAGVATYVSDHWLYLGMDSVRGGFFARDGGVALPITPDNPYLHEFMHWFDVPNRITATGENRLIGDHMAREYTLIYNQPDADNSSYLAWTGRFWAIDDLPLAMGWYGLPGSPFAGRSERFRQLWGGLSEDLSSYGLIVQADITLHDGVTQHDLRALLEGSSDLASFTAKGAGHERVIIQITDLQDDDGYALATRFPDGAPFGETLWPHSLPDQPVAILGRY